ncbi:hypothetical protein BDR26DRAFT_51695 [Obelidium mucronatum]|nr:hypothetical protein BDR26DRAFT_51695 [Obelidium mucronatum]
MSGPSSPWTVVLPKTPWQFQSSSCPVAGSTLCAGPGSSFINQCVTLPAGGGWVGGSSYYQYQCPWGSTCQTVNGIDACVGGVVVPSTTAVTTAATTKSTTVPPSVTAPTKSTTTTTTTTTSRPPTTTTTTTTTLRPTSTTTTTTTVPVTKSTTTTIKPTTSTTTTTTTTTKATATSSVIGVACYPAWSSTAVYPTAGTGKVSYQNGNYVNKWWTQNEVPDSTKPNGAWTYQGPCGGSTQPSTTTTTAAQTTAGGSTVTKTVSTATASSTSVVIIPGTPCPVLADNSLRLPYPVGQTCVDVKHACQDFCTSHQWYTIQRNQCFSEDTTNNTAIQWCQCNDVTYYGVAFGKPTTACPV